eukprot:Colp12_sorted_trinity150504_noHs@5286
MLVTTEGFHALYTELKKRALDGDCSILVLAAQDCDSVCAVRILTALFKADLLSYALRPISGYDDYKLVNDELIAQGDKARSVVMINCGGNVSIEEYFPSAETVVYYVIDSHRPLNLSNVNRYSKRVKIMVEREIETEHPDLDDLDPAALEEDEEEEEDEEDEDEDEDEGFEVEEGEDADANDSVRSRKQRKLEKEEKKKQKEELRQRVGEYYKGSGWGHSA